MSVSVEETASGNNSGGVTGKSGSSTADSGKAADAGNAATDITSETESAPIENAEEPADDGMDKYGIGYEPIYLDAQYFKPATDDYIVSDCLSNTGKVELISFNNSGKMIQWIMRDRKLNADRVTTADNISDYYQERDPESLDGYNAAVFGPKTKYLADCVKQGVKPYIAQKLTEEQTVTHLSASPESVGLPYYETILPTLGFGGDYYITCRESSKEEKVTSYTIGYEHQSSIQQKVRGYHAFHYLNVWVYDYDKNGKNVRCACFMIFDEESMVDDYLKSQYGSYYDGKEPVEGIVDATLPPDFDISTTGYTRKDNMLYYEGKVESDAKLKWERRVGESSKENDCFSREYLTNDQIAAMLSD